MKALIAKYGPTVLHFGAAVVGFLSPAVQAYVGAHPGNTLLIGALWAQVMHLVQSPLQK